ncbi:MAG: pseudaminic acid biosynthesis-associated methylase, partial [Candidatus Saccharibacteria bacterium]
MSEKKMTAFKTEQEDFWAGEFGDEYVNRNRGASLLASNIAFFSEILQHARGVRSILEFGANIGMNLLAFRQLLPHAELSAIEINQTAVDELKKLEQLKVYHQSILDFTVDYQRDLVLTKGVLIHLNPD